MWKNLFKRMIEARMEQAKKLVRMYDDCRAFEELNSLTDSQLRDIGITRWEIPKYIFGGLSNGKTPTNGTSATLS